MAQLMPLPLTVSCFSKIHVGFTFLVPAHPGSPGQTAVSTGVRVVYNLPNLLYGDVGTCGSTTCPRLLYESGTAGFEPTTFQLQIQHPDHYTTLPRVSGAARAEGGKLPPMGGRQKIM